MKVLGVLEERDICYPNMQLKLYHSYSMHSEVNSVSYDVLLGCDAM